MKSALKTAVRYFFAALTLAISIYLAYLIYRDVRYNYITGIVQSEGIKLNGWVIGLNEEDLDVTFRMENGEDYTGSYSSDFYDFRLNDTLEFKYSPKFPGEYKHINEYPNGALTVINYLALIIILILLIIFYRIVFIRQIKQTGP